MTDINVTNARPDFLSPLATTILQAYQDAYQQLVVSQKTPSRAHKLLMGVSSDQLLTVPVKNADDASAMLGGLWLWHDGLTESHGIVQDLIGPTGSFWHAIMHRREGDFSNARYWYARCADHRALRLISAMANDTIGRETSDQSLLRIVGGEFNPEAFVDLVEAIHNEPSDPRHDAVVRLQQLEWEALFQHCAYEAAGASGGMI